MREGDLVRVRGGFRGYYNHGRMVEFPVGTLAVIVSKSFARGREYYDILIDGGIWAVMPGVIEPLDPCNLQPTVV